jgi:hypothetical protein
VSPRHARAYLVAILLISTGLTFGFDEAYDALPSVVQAFLILTAVITGVGWTLVVGALILFLGSRAFPR